MTNNTNPLQERIARILNDEGWTFEGVHEPGDYDECEDCRLAAAPIAARIAQEIAAEVQAAAEHRIARLEAQTDIRGRAVVMYRDRAREAEARVKAVRAIHRDLYESMSGVPYCDECDRAWPCPTIRALDGDA